MKVKITSFGRKYGTVDADLVLDVRCLENPFWVPGLRELNGKDEPVRGYILERSREYLEKLQDFLLLDLSLARGRACEELHIAVGCTGGRHRSVCVAVLLKELLERENYDVSLYHRDLERG